MDPTALRTLATHVVSLIDQDGPEPCTVLLIGGRPTFGWSGDRPATGGAPEVEAMVDLPAEFSGATRRDQTSRTVARKPADGCAPKGIGS